MNLNPEELLGMSVLIVDDEPVNIALLEDMLEFSGYTRVSSTTDPRRVLALCRERQPDLVLLDLNMPHLDGFAVLGQLNAEYPKEDCLPVLVLTADISLESKRRALAAGATDFLTKPFDAVEVMLRIRNLLRTRRQHVQLSDQKELLEDSVRERTAELQETLTQLQAAQGQIIQQERLSALGSMTAGIAHDFNNILSLILGYSEMLTRMLQRPGGEKMAPPLLGTIINSAQDAAKMFNRLRDFYRPAAKGHPRQLLDLNGLIEQAAALTRPRWHGQALAHGVTNEMTFDLAKGLPEVLADAAELRELLTNLIFNAVDAMPGGGTITLRTRPADDGVTLEIADTGTGMTAETRARCLEPFYTTKGEKGTGLGLAMVYGTVQRHGGTIDLRSEPGEGTTFALHFPLDQPEPEAEDEFAECATLPPLRVLVVDDQPVLCEILVEYLAEEGHAVTTATDGLEALEKFRAFGHELIITDNAMPGMSGEQLAAEIRQLAPATRIIMLTGYAATGEDGQPPANVDMIVDKPVTREALCRAAARVMNGAGQKPLNARPPAEHLEYAVGC